MAAASVLPPKATHAGMPRLDSSALDLAAFRKQARADLLAALDGLPSPLPAPRPPRGGAASTGGHALVLDPTLSGPLGLVAEVKEFKEHGIDKIYHLMPEPLNTDCTSVVYFIRPELRLAMHVATQIQAHERARAGRGEPGRAYALFFVPRRSMLCEKLLEDEGVYGLLRVRECALPVFVLEDDVLSLEQPKSCFRDLFLEGDRTVLHTCATALARLQAIFGRIPLVRGKGECAGVVIKLMQQMLSALDEDDAAFAAAGATGAARGARAPLPSQSAIAELLLLDRDVDLATPLCTELTYEGLLHQLFQIKHGFIDVEPEVLGLEKGSDGPGGARVKRELNNNDRLYSTIRNLNFGELGPLLNQLARSVSSGYEERHQAQTVSQIRDYMKKLSRLQQEHKSLATHVALAERIQRVTREAAFHKRLECEQEALSSGACSAEAEALLEDLVGHHMPLTSVLRLLCLLSVVSNGLKPKTLSALQAEITHAYGFGPLALTWAALTKLGLLKKHEGTPPWTKLKRSLRLVVDDVPEHALGDEPADMAYVYAGYAPLSVRLLHSMLSINPAVEESIRLLPGPFQYVVQKPRVTVDRASADLKSSAAAAIADGATAGGAGSAGALPSPAPSAASAAAAPTERLTESGERRPPVTLVCFVGGCTYSEIAALRWLGRNATPRRDYIVLTTHMLNGDALIESLIATCENGLERLD